MSTNGSTTSYVYNALDQLTVITNPNSTYVYQSYDGRGNLYQTVDGGNITSYSYDYADRLTTATVPGHSVSYGYDADGHRVGQTVDGATTSYLWDEQGYGEVGLEQSGSNTTNYLLAGGQRLAVTTGGLTNYYLPDGLGNIRSLAGSSGNLTADRYNYDAYGSLRAGSVSSTQNAYRYKGQQFDQATGLYSLRARYYNSGQGRFLSQDKAGYNFENPVELNRYGYTVNNPVNLVDFSGRTSLVEYRALFWATFNAGRYQVMRLVGLRIAAKVAGAVFAGRAKQYLQILIKYEDEHPEARNTLAPYTTVAVSEADIAENGVMQEVVAVNDSAPDLAKRLITEAATENNAKMVEGAEHAEANVYNALRDFDTFRSIGVSHWKGPCGPGPNTCTGFFVDVNKFFSSLLDKDFSDGRMARRS